ncbi:MAG TPA: lysophospholipase [Blastocatellia bacterium]|nr:lysophospholipase [Blastocatellia bacterium]
MNRFTYTEESLAANDGLQLYVRRCEASRPAGEVIIVHGFGEHSGRYTALTEHLVNAGYSVTAYDHRGHGRSEGLPGHVENFTEYEKDLNHVIEWTGSRGSTADLFLLAHSMGGLVSLRYLSQGANKSRRLIRGAVISAPLIAVAIPVPQHKLIIGHVAAKLAPRLRLENEIDPTVLSRDASVGVAYAADPLVHRKVSARWFSEAGRAMNELVEHASRITAPLLILHGSADRLASVDATRALFPKITSGDKQLVILEGYYHELFNEPEKRELFKRVTIWLAERATS